MKIASVQIQKFRSIDNATVSIDQILAIVGANNAGKSHILRALNAFFNYNSEYDGFINQDHAYSLRSRPKITVVFCEITVEDEINPDLISNNTLTLRFTYRWDRKSPAYEVVIANRTQALNSEQFESLISHFRYIYVPIIRNYETTFLDGEGIAYRLLKSILQQQIANRNTIQPLVDKLVSKVENTVFKSAIASIKRYYPFQKSSDFTLQITNRDVVEVIIREVALSLTESAQINKIDNCGSGIQSAVYFAISLAISMGDQINYLVGVEEPELNMHPQAQRQLVEALKDQGKYPNTQFILTTHSTVVIDKLGHTSIALCRKSKGQTRDIVTSLTQIGLDFWDKYQFTSERYYHFYQYKNSDFFFSNYIIITESPTDCNIIAALLKKYNIDIESFGISLIPADGEKSIKYPYALPKELGIPFVCIVDRDVFQPYKFENRKESLGEDGIPVYKPEGKPSSPIYDLFDENDLHNVVNCFIHDEYNDALEILKDYHIVSMRYALEVDLAICDSYCNALCDILGLPEENRNAAYLLRERGNKIKEFDVITEALERVPTRNLPKSYKQIINCIRNMLNT